MLCQMYSMYVRTYLHMLSPVLKLNTALVRVANKLREEGDITMRQLEGEKKKSPSKRASGKIELLKKNMAEVCMHYTTKYVRTYVCNTRVQSYYSILLYVRTYLHTYLRMYKCTYVHANIPFPCFSQSQAKLNAVESQINAIVASVFSERYRDVVEDVRGRCIEELGVWIIEYKYVRVYVHTCLCTDVITYV